MPLIKSFRGNLKVLGGVLGGFRGSSRGVLGGNLGLARCLQGGLIGGILEGCGGFYKVFSPELSEISHIFGSIYCKISNKMAYFQRFLCT